jgi:hypothetical protein
MLDHGVYSSLAELADAERINRSYVSRVLRLTLLLPKLSSAYWTGAGHQVCHQLLKPFRSSGRSRKSSSPDRLEGRREDIKQAGRPMQWQVATVRPSA